MNIPQSAQIQQRTLCQDYRACNLWPETMGCSQLHNSCHTLQISQVQTVHLTCFAVEDSQHLESVVVTLHFQSVISAKMLVLIQPGDLKPTCQTTKFQPPSIKIIVALVIVCQACIDSKVYEYLKFSLASSHECLPSSPKPADQSLLRRKMLWMLEIMPAPRHLVVSRLAHNKVVVESPS